jgi:Sporulation and spore germination
VTVAAPPRPPQLRQPQLPQPVHDAEPDAPDALIEEARQRARTRRRRYAALALVAAAGLGVYVGLVNGGGADVPAPPADAQASPAAVPADPNSAHFEVWFVHGSDQGPCCWMYPTWRTAAQLGISPDEDIYTRRELNGPAEHRRAADLLESVLRNLIAGPTPGELRERSWNSVVRPDTRLLGVTLTHGIATINIASELDPSTPARTPPDFLPPTGKFSYMSGQTLVAVHRLSQLVYTATQFPFVDGVRFQIDGRPVKVRAGRNFALRAGNHLTEPLARPVTREDYAAN